MEKIAIALEAWKVPIYQRHLADAGYFSERRPGLTPDPGHVSLHILATNEEVLEFTLQAAAMEAAEHKGRLQRAIGTKGAELALSVERCRCGYPMPCRNTVPITLCKARTLDPELLKDPKCTKN